MSIKRNISRCLFVAIVRKPARILCLTVVPLCFEED